MTSISKRFPFFVTAAPVRGRLFSFSRLILFCTVLPFACSQQGPADRQWAVGWKETSSLQTARAGAAAVVHNSFIYVIGGVDGRIFLRTVEFAPILADGRLGEWRSTSILPEARGFTDAVVYDGFVYVVGGGKGQHGQQLLSTVTRAPIRKDGHLGAWEVLDEAMQVPRRCSKVCVHDGQLFSFGGYGGALLDSVEVAAIDSSSGLMPWRLNRKTMLQPRYVNAVKKVGDFVYVLGGHHQSKGIGIADVEYSDLNRLAADRGDAWRMTSALNEGRYGLGAVKLAESLFVFGGLSGLEYLDSVERALINEDGSLQSWHVQPIRLPQPMANFSIVTNNDHVYLLAGANRAGYGREVFYSQLNAQSQLGVWLNDGEQEASVASFEAQAPRLQGQVVEVLQTEQYTYLHLQDGGRQRWIAGPRIDVRPGTSVEHSQGVLMSGYFSQVLQRSFDKILFVGQLVEKKE